MNKNSSRELGLILVGIGGLVLSLYGIFHKLATGYLDLPIAIGSFVLVCILLILSLAFGFLALSLTVLPVSIER
jgi:hypothetical protein